MARVTSTEILAAIKEERDGMSDEAWTTLGKVVVAELELENQREHRELAERHSECGRPDSQPLPPGGYH
jgi:hypothetical protein